MDPQPLPQSNQVVPPVPNKKTLKLAKIIALAGVLVVIAIIIVLLSALLVKKDTKPAQTIDANKSIQSELKVSELPDYHYYVRGYEPDAQGNNTLELYKTSKDLTKLDTKLNSLKVSNSTNIILKSWKKGTILIKTETASHYVIQTLELTLNAQPQTILEVSKDLGNQIFDARLLNEGKTLAYITYTSKNPKESNNVVLHVQNLGESTVKSIPLADTVGLYTGFWFVAKSPDENTLYLSEGGGDGGRSWATWHKADLAMQKVEKLANLPIISKETNNPAYTIINPSATYAAFIDMSELPDEADLEKPDSTEALIGCLDYAVTNVLQKYANTGGTVSVTNLKTGQTQEVYRNLNYGNNLCQNKARRIISILWLDDKTLAVQTIDGVYSLDIETKQGKELYYFKQSSSPGQVTRPMLVSIEQPFILFDDASVGIMDSNNLVQYLSKEVQQATFFSLNQFE